MQLILGNLELAKQCFESVEAQNNAFVSQVGSFVEEIAKWKPDSDEKRLVQGAVLQIFQFSNSINERIQKGKAEVSVQMVNKLSVLRSDNGLENSGNQENLVNQRNLGSQQNQEDQQHSWNQESLEDQRLKFLALNLPDNVFGLIFKSPKKRKSEIEDWPKMGLNNVGQMAKREQPEDISEILKCGWKRSIPISECPEPAPPVEQKGAGMTQPKTLDKKLSVPPNKPPSPQLPLFIPNDHEKLLKNPDANKKAMKVGENMSRAMNSFFGKRKNIAKSINHSEESRSHSSHRLQNTVIPPQVEQKPAPENHSNHQEGEVSKRERGTYRICTKVIKDQAIELSKKKGIKTAALELKIPEKNIKRWIKHGPDRKKGAGRKTMDPKMEQGLLNWIAEVYRDNHVFPDFREVKEKAKSFSTNSNFKASKGWCDKFMKRNFDFFKTLREET